MEAAAAILGNLLSRILPTLLSVIREKCKKLEPDVQFILAELEFMQAAIQDPRWRRKGTSNLRRGWIAQLRRLADEIEDCMDSFQVNRTSAARFVKQIGDLRKRLDQTNDRLHRYLDSAEPSNEVPVDEFPTVAVASSNRRQIPPMMQAEEDLLALVQSRQSETMVISVVGFGDQKTDLARRVYENNEVSQQFSQRAWVSAVDKTVDDVLADILLQVQNEPRTAGLGNLIILSWVWVLSIFSWSFQGLLLKFFGAKTEMPGPSQSCSDVVHQPKSCLRKNRYLIVIHDVETEEVFDGISAFPWANRVDGRIIMTTAIRSAVRPCTCGNDLPLHVPDSSRTLVLVGEVGRKRYDETCFALCAAAVARTQGLHASNYERVVLEDCLLYFSMFPVHHHVKRNPLIRRWLAEGLFVHAMQQVPENVYRFAQDVAAMHLDTLIDRNIIESIKKSNNGKVKRCQPPWMVFNHICGNAVIQNFITLLCGQSDQTTREGYIRRLSLHPSSVTPNGGFNVPDVPRLRTMVVFPTAGAQYGAILSFDDHKLLRVLDLKECADVNGDHLLIICDLLLLKYLSLGDSIERVPRKIRRLRRLETLEMRTSDVVTVYSELLMLPKLKHLLGKFQLSLVDSPKEEKPPNMFSDVKKQARKLLLPKDKFAELQNFLRENSVLETLAGIIVGNGKGFPQLLGHLNKLRKVKIWSDSSCTRAGAGAGSTDLTDLKAGIKLFTRHGNRTPNVDYSLSIDFNGSSQPFLDSLEDPGTLTSLKLSGNLTSFRPVVAELYSLQELCLSWTALTGAAIQSGLSNLTCQLKYLKLIEENLAGLTIQNLKPFASLQRICLVGTQSLQHITIQNLSKLASLHLLCQTLGVLPGIQIGSLKNLVEIGLHSGVDDQIKRGWETDAKRHHLKPHVLPVEIP